MKLTLIALTCLALLAGCAKQDDQKVAALQAQLKTLEESTKQTEQRNETLQDQVTDLDGKLRDAKVETDSLRVQLQNSKSAANDAGDKLAERIAQLEAQIERLEQAAAAQPDKPTEPDTPLEPVTQEPKADLEVKKQLDDLLSMIKGGDNPSLEKAIDLVERADKQTRDDYIASIQQWVKEEPENKQARMALAAVLTTRFRDLKDPMKMGALAGQIKTEAEKALEIDPGYYDAVHFLAILKVNYPTFTPEFKDANTTLDKALGMHKSLTWEDRFGDIYAAYGMWYRMQAKHDDGLGWVQKGLDKAPRHQGLLDEQKRLEDAKANPED